MDSKNINIVCCLEDSFELGFTVMFDSLMAHLSSEWCVSLFLLYCRLEVSTIERLRDHLRQDRVVATFIEIDLHPLSGVEAPAHLSIETYFRLLIPATLPPEITKVLYLDCDLLITDNVGNLWEIDLSQKLIALAVNWNSGVMLFNLNLWRRKGTANILIEYVRNFPEKCPMADNSAIMAKISGPEITFFDTRWNMSHEIGAGHQGIIHFIGAIKPWHYYYWHQHHLDIFFQHLDKTSWIGWRPVRPSLTLRLVHQVKLIRSRSVILKKASDTNFIRCLMKFFRKVL